MNYRWAVVIDEGNDQLTAMIRYGSHISEVIARLMPYELLRIVSVIKIGVLEHQLD